VNRSGASGFCLDQGNAGMALSFPLFEKEGRVVSMPKLSTFYRSRNGGGGRSGRVSRLRTRERRGKGRVWAIIRSIKKVQRGAQRKEKEMHFGTLRAKKKSISLRGGSISGGEERASRPPFPEKKEKKNHPLGNCKKPSSRTAERKDGGGEVASFSIIGGGGRGGHCSRQSGLNRKRP